MADYTLYAPGQKVVSEVYHGKDSILYIYKGSQLIWASAYELPTSKSVPLRYTTQDVARTSGAQNKTYTVPETGFYEVEVMGASGASGYKGAAGGPGGKIKTIVYLYKDSVCLLWSGATAGHGYPANNQTLGGRGGYGSGGADYGGAGGSPSCSPTTDEAWGGGGSGFICGTSHMVQDKTFSDTAWNKTINSLEGWSVGDYSVSHAYSFLLCGGGGGGCGDNGSYRAGGGGGGAWGNGGLMSGGYADAGNSGYGPGGTWGKGGDTSRYSGGGAGGWAILDFSRNVKQYGTGGGGGAGTSGYCILRQLTRTSRYLTINNNQGATILMTYNGTTSQRSYLEIDGGTVVYVQIVKHGYIGQDGTITLNDDTVLDIILKEIPTPENLDMGQISESVTQTTDCGTLTGTTDERINCGGLNG